MLCILVFNNDALIKLFTSLLDLHIPCNGIIACYNYGEYIKLFDGPDLISKKKNWGLDFEPHPKSSKKLFQACVSKK